MSRGEKCCDTELSAGAFTEMIGYIERRHHTFLRRELPRLAELLERMTKAGGESRNSAPYEVEQIYTTLKTNIEAHLRTEEQVLFPCIRQIEACSQHHCASPLSQRRALRDVLRQIEREHEEVLQTFQHIRQMTSDYSPAAGAPENLHMLYGGLRLLEEDLREHIRLEDSLGTHVEQISSTAEELMRMESDLSTARDVQQVLLPDRLPDAKGPANPAFCVKAIPAKKVGGDLHEFFFKDDRTLVLALGDVAGKGVPAALLMTMTWTLLLQFAKEEDSPSAVLGRMNRALYEATDPTRFVTMFLAFYDTEDRSLRFANAGHCPAIVAKPDGSTTILNSTATVLGLFEEFRVADEEVRLACGDKLVAYTDGITEASDGDGEMFGLSRLTEMVAAGVASSPRELVDSIIDAAQRYQADHQASDDTTIWVLEAL